MATGSRHPKGRRRAAPRPVAGVVAEAAESAPDAPSPPAVAGGSSGWAFVVAAVGLGILLLHFRGLLLTGLDQDLWGISLSADPLSDMALVHDFLWRLTHGCGNADPLQSFPFGSEVSFPFLSMLNPSLALDGVLQLVTGRLVAAHNLTIMLIFLANFAGIYVASRRLLGDRLVALVPATLVTFSAYAYAHSWAHLGLLTLFPLAWFLAACHRLQGEAATPRDAVIAGALFGALVTISPYYGYMALWIAASLAAASVVVDRSCLARRGWWALNGLCAAVGLASSLPFLWASFFRDHSGEWIPVTEANYGQNELHLLSFTARPLDYLLNVNHFLYGSVFQALIPDQTTLRHPLSDEVPVYLGALPVIFLLLVAVTGLAAVVWRRGRPAVVDRVTAPVRTAWKAERRLCLGLALVLVTAFLISLPPSLPLPGGLPLPLPNALFRHILPFRSYSRFAIVVLLAASFWLATALKLWRWRSWAVAAVVLACAFESAPALHLHPASADIDYIAFLRSRPETVMVRFEQQNRQQKLPLILERLLADKATVNGDVNLAFGYTELPLLERFPRFDIGMLGQMGGELLVVDGRYQPSDRDASHLEKLGSFPLTNHEVWKILPSADPVVASLFRPYLEARARDVCAVGDHEQVKRTLGEFYNYIRGL